VTLPDVPRFRALQYAVGRLHARTPSASAPLRIAPGLCSEGARYTPAIRRSHPSQYAPPLSPSLSPNIPQRWQYFSSNRTPSIAPMSSFVPQKSMVSGQLRPVLQLSPFRNCVLL